MDKEKQDQIEKEVLLAYDIRRSDLNNLAFEIIKWKCLSPMCKCGTMVRDYGISPYFYSPRKGWGWVDGSDWWMMCGKHWKHRERILSSIKHRLTAKYFLLHFLNENSTLNDERSVAPGAA